MKSRLVFDAAVTGIFVWMAVMSAGFHPLARTFPLYVTSTAAVLGAVNLVVDMTHLRRGVSTSVEITTASAVTAELPSSETQGRSAKASDLRDRLRYLAWIGGLCIGVVVLGALICIPFFLLGFLMIESKLSLRSTVVAVAVVLGMVLLFKEYLNLALPPGMIL